MTEMLTITKKGLESYENKISELTKERDELAAKCAEMRWTLQENLKCHIGDYGCPACKTRIEKLLASDQCGTGWLSPEKAGRLREALEKLARLGNEPHYGNSIGNEIAKQALEACNDL